MNIKAETVEQYHILRYIKQHLETEHFEIELVHRYCVKITDTLGESLCLTWDGSKVVVEKGHA